MEEWKSYKLGDISTIQTGPFGSQLHQSDYVESGVPCIMPTNIGRMLDFQVAGIAHISEGDALKLSRHIVHEGDIVYSRRGDIEKCAYVSQEQDGWFCGTGCLKITINSNLAVPKFVAYYLSTDEIKSWIVGNAVGTTMLNLNTSVLADVPLSLPSIQMQKRCVQILDSIENIIALNDRINHNLEEQAQALYKSWFVDFEPFKGGKFVDSELGMIPEGWHVGTLSELLEVRYGKDHKALKDGSTPVFGSGGLMRYAERALYNGESVLIPGKGTLNNVMYFNGPFWTVDTMFYTVERSSNVIKYCHLFLLTQDLASMNAGSAVPSMTTDILNNLPLLIPSSQVLEAFNRVLSSIYEARSQREEESNSLSQSRDTILPQLMSGALTNTLLTC